MGLSSSQAPHGWQICRKIITDKLPFGPNDYQLEGITQALDGQDVVAVSATGSGKSVYIYMLAIILLELANDPLLSPIEKKFPLDPAVVAMCPTTALEDDLVRSS
jgi:superfamily II DNA/RNA helicase